ncbi:aspartate--tRNA ligase [Opitutus terrae]|uniref:Aspartate--tRNA(Asp/Asn) ligase n=1 Tax=Opitutus terrae (strain DSM 11246 / JCM 15787 / PB90-1) TaxID=452637 RepID=SYDND_OPITP|nr:aspartate--tRNA ligase [Opitutus terrae]B1ZSW8.1 RecName: Full=Aspartate--tRNA(Asp/Asn) ligase; AltName: Full=Aspartyl-tRNA synthetase; Short=AspRS; AltName: Full=Non-discriminating aspartyl-tRNA synthetase; Short=ND-AspRS [Opitutus terrae PB90-1]ACB75757.1 aspartyl-tRNA synthetase [Opitutus terrae PB90-1]
MHRTHHCAQLTTSQLGATVSLLGWVDTIRDQGGIIFVDLRDRKGITQIQLEPHENAKLAEQVKQLKPESVIGITGKVVRRPAGTENPALPTGEVEVVASSLEIHNISDTPPFPLDDAGGDKVNEDLRLTYRYLDLRRPKMRKNLQVRHRAAKSIRDYFDAQEFIEVETPALFKSTPEGAREYLVPSRIHPGQFYALSQSPQQFKQILMVAGVEKYFQIARCFRDEDLRADRQMEFTQVDVEASFVTREDIYALFEGMLKKVWKDVLDVDIPTPFPRMAFHDAMNRYGVDKPDVRFALELADFSELFKNSAFKVFQSTVAGGGVVKALNAKGLADLTQGELKSMEDTAKSLGAKGLAFIKVEGGEWKSPIVKFFTEPEKAELTKRLNIEEGDIIFFAAAPWEKACAILGRLRLESAAFLQKRGKLTIRHDDWQFLWVIDFPLMTYDEAENRYVATHHPFTAPVPDDTQYLDSDPKKVRGQHYDVVLNGMELGGGSIRIHQPVLQKKVFEDVLKIPQDVVESRFGYMLKAFTYGAPPHGGIAFGLDRMVALLCGTTSIRDVIAFPKTQKGQDLMAQSPTPVTPRQLKDLHIQTVMPE